MANIFEHEHIISIAVATVLLVSTGYHVHRLLLKYTVKLDV